MYDRFRKYHNKWLKEHSIGQDSIDDWLLGENLGPSIKTTCVKENCVKKVPYHVYYKYKVAQTQPPAAPSSSTSASTTTTNSKKSNKSETASKKSASSTELSDTAASKTVTPPPSSTAPESSATVAMATTEPADAIVSEPTESSSADSTAVSVKV